MYQEWRKTELLELWEIIYRKEEEVQEDPRNSGPTPFLQETGYQPNRKKQAEEEVKVKLAMWLSTVP
jgi:hypothetical protein